LMFDASALWVAARHRIPMLVVMVNNRAWNNDWVHQREIARDRGTPMDNTGVGIVIEDPAPDFAALARSFGWHATGPVTDPAAAEAEVRKAADLVMATGRPALVDVICSADG
jgi:acetolactate synthase I/II/III large subunit